MVDSVLGCPDASYAASLTGTVRQSGIALQGGWFIFSLMRLDLEQMSREEKLKAMHQLWEDLARDEVTVESPAWHADALREVEERMRQGSTIGRMPKRNCESEWGESPNIGLQIERPSRAAPDRHRSAH